MKGYSIRLRFGTMIKDLYFQIEDENGADAKWEEAAKGLESIGDSCTNGSEFFKKAIAHYANFGFWRIEK